MSTVAEQLRAAREARNLTIQQVAESTKIRTDHIRALEEGNFNVFSAPIYIRGSVKNYATLLKLDVPQIMAALDAELGQTEKYSEPPPSTEASNTPLDRLMFLLSKLNWRSEWPAPWSWAFYWSFALVGLAWRHHRPGDPLAGLQPAVYQPSQFRGDVAACVPSLTSFGGASSASRILYHEEIGGSWNSPLRFTTFTCRSNKSPGCATDKSGRTPPSARRSPKA